MATREQWDGWGRENLGEGWVLIPTGNPTLTRRAAKTDGAVDRMETYKSSSHRYTNRIGVWARPAALAAELTDVPAWPTAVSFHPWEAWAVWACRPDAAVTTLVEAGTPLDKAIMTEALEAVRATGGPADLAEAALKLARDVITRGWSADLVGLLLNPSRKAGPATAARCRTVRANLRKADRAGRPVTPQVYTAAVAAGLTRKELTKINWATSDAVRVLPVMATLAS